MEKSPRTAGANTALCELIAGEVVQLSTLSSTAKRISAAILAKYILLAQSPLKKGPEITVTRKEADIESTPPERIETALASLEKCGLISGWRYAEDNSEIIVQLSGNAAGKER